MNKMILEEILKSINPENIKRDNEMRSAFLKVTADFAKEWDMKPMDAILCALAYSSAAITSQTLQFAAGPDAKNGDVINTTGQDFLNHYEAFCSALLHQVKFVALGIAAMDKDAVAKKKEESDA